MALITRWQKGFETDPFRHCHNALRRNKEGISDTKRPQKKSMNLLASPVLFHAVSSARLAETYNRVFQEKAQIRLKIEHLDIIDECERSDSLARFLAEKYLGHSLRKRRNTEVGGPLDEEANDGHGVVGFVFDVGDDKGAGFAFGG